MIAGMRHDGTAATGGAFAPRGTTSLAIPEVRSDRVSERSLARRRWILKRANGYLNAGRRRLGLPVPSSGPPHHYARTVVDRRTADYLEALDLASMTATEVTGNFHEQRPWASYRHLEYPEFDLCLPYEGPESDVVLCEQVIQHVPDPIAAARSLYAMCAPGGHVLVSTSLLIRLHEMPTDYWRFSPAGLDRLLRSVGFSVHEASGWGNRQAVRANFSTWARQTRWRSLANEREFPVVVWAFARRPTVAEAT
jgi:hypothetical protein